MTRQRYFRRTAWTLGFVSLFPAGAGVVSILANATYYGVPVGQAVGMIILGITGAIVGGALLLAWVALQQSTFARALLVGVGVPLALEGGLRLRGVHGELPAAILWLLLLALPAVLGAATFHGQDGRRWLRWGAWIVGVVIFPLIIRPPNWIPMISVFRTEYLAVPFGMAAVLAAVLYWSVPGKPLRLRHLLLEGVVALALSALTSLK